MNAIPKFPPEQQLTIAELLAFTAERPPDARGPPRPMLGVGTRVPVSPNSLPQPDVFVKEGAAADSHVTDDALVLFEVLSRADRKAWREWRRKVYASVPNCRHYVTVSLKRAEIVVYDQATQWRPRTIRGLEAVPALPALAVEMRLADVSRYTPIGQP